MPSPKATLLLCASAALAAAFALWPHSAKEEAAAAAAAPVVQLSPAGPGSDAADIACLLRSGALEAAWKGNGRDTLMLEARNLSAQPVSFRLGAGQLFASEKSTVALLRSRTVTLAPRAAHSETLATAAVSSVQPPAEAVFAISGARLARLDPLFAHLDRHPEIPPAAAQTAVLALTENLPLGAFARFAQITGGKPARSAIPGFQAETCDILAALLAVREIGMEKGLALTIDPQLEVEAMIDPLAHPLALLYYNVSDEWAYWRHELLEGACPTRHYALYGIARFYPEVALQMLPKWAREPKTQAVFRASAVQALAETQRPEAVTILRQLEAEFGAATDLGKSAHTAANFLDAQFSRAGHASAAALRFSKNSARQQRQREAEASSTAARLASAN